MSYLNDKNWIKYHKIKRTLFRFMSIPVLSMLQMAQLSTMSLADLDNVPDCLSLEKSFNTVNIVDIPLASRKFFTGKGVKYGYAPNLFGGTNAIEMIYEKGCVHKCVLHLFVKNGSNTKHFEMFFIKNILVHTSLDNDSAEKMSASLSISGLDGDGSTKTVELTGLIRLEDSFSWPSFISGSNIKVYDTEPPTKSSCLSSIADSARSPVFDSEK